MSILNVNQLQPVGGGNTITVGSSNIDYSGSITGNISVDGNLTVTGVVSNEDVTNIDSVGLITARSGISITGGDLTIPDAIIHDSDTNTRIRFPASDTFAVETAGNERLRIESNGFVKTNTELWVGGALPVLRWRNSTTEYATARISSNDLYFEVANAERLRITSTGAIGIGSNFTAIETTGGGGITLDSGGGGGNIGVFLKSTGYTGNQTKLWQDSANAVSYLESTERPLIIKAGDGSGDYLRMDVAGSEKLHISSIGQLTTKGSNQGNPVGIEIRNNNANAYSHAELKLTSQNTTTSKIWCDVPNSGMRLNYNGGTSVKIDQSGNLVMGNGAGIDFSATANSSGTMSSELLDDYEEGTFTPVWGSGSAAYSSPAPTYNTASGHYTKIGNVVYYDIHLVTTAWNGAGSTMWIYGLPFTTRSSLYQQGNGSTFCIEGVDSQDAISNLTTQVAPNKTNIELYYQTPATGANYNTFGTNNVSEGNQVNIRVSGFYYTNS